MNILITGSEGVLAKNLLKIILKNKKFNIFSLNKQNLDITDINKVNQTIESIKPSIIVNTAAFTNVDIAEKKKRLANKVNFIGVKNLSIISKKYNIFLIHISTDYVFDGKNKKLYKEFNKTNPISIYGKSKDYGEKFIIKNLKNYLIIRVSWLFEHNSNNFVTNIYNKLIQEKKIFVVNDQFGRPTSYENFSKFIYKFILHIQNLNFIFFGIYNFSSLGNLSSRYQIAKYIKHKIINNNINISKCKIYPFSTNKIKLSAKRPYNSGLSMNKTSKLFKFKNISWKNSIINELKKFNV